MLGSHHVHGRPCAFNRDFQGPADAALLGRGVLFEFGNAIGVPMHLGMEAIHFPNQ